MSINGTRKGTNVVWVERLAFPHVLLFLVMSLCRRFEIRYDENNVSSKAAKILIFLKKIHCTEIFSPAGLLLNLKDDQGYALDYQRADDLSAIVELFCGEKIPHEPQWFVNMTKCYLSSYLDSRITFITMVRRQISMAENCKHEIYLTSQFVNYVLKDYFKQKGIIIRQFIPAGSYLRMIMKPFYLIMRTIMQQMVSNNVSGTVKEDYSKPSIWIEHEPKHGIWEDFRSFMSLCCQNKDYDFVYYFDRVDTPVNKESTDSLQNMGFRWLDLRNTKQAFITWRDLVGIIKYAGTEKPCNPLWIVFFRLEFKMYTLLYSNLFKKYNAKALIQHQEMSWLQEAQAQAIQSAGGIMVGIHWSNYLNYKYPSYLTPQHVFFVWGAAHYELLQKKGNTCNYILPCGLWIKGDENADLLSLDFSEEVEFTISVFDDNAAYNIYQSPETASLFYTSIAEILEENKRFGAIIKSKTYDIADLLFLPMGSDIVRRFRSLLLQKRLIMLDFKSFSPVMAAKKSSLSVCCGINSAGIIAGLHGCSVVCWDCTGWQNFPIYKDKNQKVAFQSVKEMKRAVKSFAEGDRTIGDFSEWRRTINYFDDISGRERIVEFIDSFFHEISDFDREEALELAKARYLLANNISQGFYESHEWWN